VKLVILILDVCVYIFNFLIFLIFLFIFLFYFYFLFILFYFIFIFLFYFIFYFIFFIFIFYFFCFMMERTKVKTFFKPRPADPSQQCKTTSNNIQDPPPRWILTIIKLKFGGGNLFSLAMTNTIEGNNSVGSLLKPLLKKMTP
jgi:hypothetical protein